MKANHWDIFCAVVDNFGDIGVCWRLARQLAVEHGLTVRLWVDNLVPLARLCPATDPAQQVQHVDGVEIRQWTFPFPTTTAADVVIEAFACELPEAYVANMAAREQAPAWINLEYLSAEAWVESCHGMTSPHPRLPLTKNFFFPGFTAVTGGLLRETDYRQRFANFDPAAFRAALGLAAARDHELTVSMFAYENPSFPGLLAAWASGTAPITCVVPEGRILADVCRYFDVTAAAPGNHLERGPLIVEVVTFLPQPDYDALLWLCDLNFVRGEDSFVRAQWAERPLVWHIYPQADAAHQAKLDAFLDRYLAGLPAMPATAARNFWNAWNGNCDAGSCWRAYREALPTLKEHAPAWAGQLSAQGNLTANLVRFAANPLAGDTKAR